MGGRVLNMFKCLFDIFVLFHFDFLIVETFQPFYFKTALFLKLI